MNKWSYTFLACLSLLTLANSAEAVSNNNSSGTSLLLFGDSYFDTGAGNAVSAQFGVPLVSPTPPYFNGRHSNGPIWVDYTSAALNLPVINYAVAGSQTGSLNINTPPSPNPIGGLLQQLGRFAATGRKVGNKEIVVVDGAANNFLALVPANLNVPAVQAAATQALTNLGTQVLPGLQKLGAEKIVLWNLGDLSMLPLFNSPVFGGLDSPLVRALMQGASNGFNAALGPVVQRLNTDLAHEVIGVEGNPQIFIFDANTAFARAAALLQSRGVDTSLFSFISQYGGPFVPNPLVPPGTDPSSLAFYDQVHPTTNAWELFSIIAAIPYFDNFINGPRFAAAAVDLALETASAHRDVVDNHFRILREQRYIFNYDCNSCCNNCDSCGNVCCEDTYYDNCCQCDRFQAYADIEGKWGSTKTRSGNFGLNYDTQVGLLGMDYRLNQNMLLGASFTYQHSHAKIKEGRGSMDLNDYVPTVYSSYFGDKFFIDLASSIHFYQFYNMKRNILLVDSSAKAHTHGCAAELNFDAGYVGRLNCLTYIPLIGLSFESLVVSRFHERGVDDLNLKSNRQYQRSLIGRLGGQLFYKLFDDTTIAFGELIYQYEFLRDHHRMGMRIVDSVDNAVIYNTACPVERNTLKYSFGFDSTFGNIVAGISYLGETNFKEYSNAVRAEIAYSF